MNIILILLIIGLPLLAQIFIKISYENNSRIKNSKELTGYDVARKILDKNGLNDLLIVETNGYLTDHYDPNRKVIKLSRNIYGNDTI